MPPIATVISAQPLMSHSGRAPRFARWGGGLAALVCLSELVEWGWTNTRMASDGLAMSPLTVALSAILLGPASVMWLGPDAVRLHWQAMSPSRLAALSMAGVVAFLVGYASLLGALVGSGSLPEVLPLSAMLLLLSSGLLAVSWQGRVRRVADRAVSFVLFSMIVPVAYGVALHLTDSIWRPSIVMTIVAGAAAMTAASMAALRWLQLDIVARRDESQASLLEVTRELESARQARMLAEQRVEQRTRFLARLSHELRTPLTTMVGFSQLMALDAREPLSASQKHKLSYVVQSGALLQRLVDDMSNLSDVDQDDLTIRRAEVEVRSVLDTVVGMMAPVARRHGVELRPPVLDAACHVWADEQRLLQILLNLVGNAIKYNRQGGAVWITVEPRYELRVEIGVHDSGHGIEAARMPQLFEPFNRLGRETSDIPGTGLGLAHCKLLAVLMEGHIDATSQAGEGTHLMLTLPGVRPWTQEARYPQPQAA